MNIGEKIKRLRTAKLMTQADLVGDVITRNMLSQIENGVANPSLDTVCYIASRLNVPVGFLLADEHDERIYLKHSEIVGIKKAFINEDYRICRDMCINSDSASDDEIQMILAECDLAIGIEEFGLGNLRASCEYLDEAIEVCSRTLYRTDFIVSLAGVYFRYIRRISATLSSDMIDEGDVNIYPAMTDEFCRFLYALERLDEQDESGALSLMESEKETSPYKAYILAKISMERGNYTEAHASLHSILHGESVVPQPTLYHVFCDIEICCREIGDFRGAYEYSIDKIELLQKLLT